MSEDQRYFAQRGVFKVSAMEIKTCKSNREVEA